MTARAANSRSRTSKVVVPCEWGGLSCTCRRPSSGRGRGRRESVEGGRFACRPSFASNDRRLDTGSFLKGVEVGEVQPHARSELVKRNAPLGDQSAKKADGCPGTLGVSLCQEDEVTAHRASSWTYGSRNSASSRSSSTVANRCNAGSDGTANPRSIRLRCAGSSFAARAVPRSPRPRARRAPRSGGTGSLVCAGTDRVDTGPDYAVVVPGSSATQI